MTKFKKIKMQENKGIQQFFIVLDALRQNFISIFYFCAIKNTSILPFLNHFSKINSKFSKQAVNLKNKQITLNKIFLKKKFYQNQKFYKPKILPQKQKKFYKKHKKHLFGVISFLKNTKTNKFILIKNHKQKKQGSGLFYRPIKLLY